MSELRLFKWLWIFPAVGVLLLAIALVSWQLRRKFEATASHAEGEVVQLVKLRSSGSWCPDVRFKTEAGRDVRFTSRSCSDPSPYRVGQRVEVLYPPGNPERAALAGFFGGWVVPMVIGLLGLMFTLIGAIVVVPPWLSGHRSAALRVSGRPVMAQVTEIAKNTGLQINGRSPWRVHAQWLDPATQRMHLYKSENLWFDPTQYVGTEIRVMVDPQRPERYWMDISGLPQVA